MTNIPYTYIIKCISTNQYYYGVRYAKGCRPSDLWSTYFTSSEYVRALVKQYGKDAFQFSVRRIFSSSSKAKLWESKVLKRMKVSSRDDFINKYDFTCYDLKNRTWINNGIETKFADELLLEDYTKQGWVKGRIFSPEHKSKISSTRKNSNVPNGMLNKNHSKETRDNWSTLRKGKIYGKTLPVVFKGIEYPTIKSACDATGAKYWHVKNEGIFF